MAGSYRVGALFVNRSVTFPRTSDGERAGIGGLLPLLPLRPNPVAPTDYHRYRIEQVPRGGDAILDIMAARL
jgi:hypothetical protein